LCLWWIPLLTPELLTLELCVTSVIMNQFSLTTRLALNEFRVSYYSHHKSQSALGETNWLFRVSGCNLTLNLYLVIQMGHHHGHPLTGAMGLHPDHWSTTLGISPRDPKDLRTDTDQTFLINQTDSACIHTIYIYIYILYNFSLSASFVFSTKPCQLVILEPRIWSFVSYHYHVTLVPTLSYLMLNSYQTHHFNFMNHLIQSSCSHHVKTHKS